MNMMIGANFAFFSLPIAPCFFKKKILQRNSNCWQSDSWLLEDFILQGQQQATESTLECNFPSRVLTRSVF